MVHERLKHKVDEVAFASWSLPLAQPCVGTLHTLREGYGTSGLVLVQFRAFLLVWPGPSFIFSPGLFSACALGGKGWLLGILEAEEIVPGIVWGGG
jgi:hypothetical protein